MRIPFAVALAALALTSAGFPARAGAQEVLLSPFGGPGYWETWGDEVNDDDFAPHEQRLSPYIHALVRYRDGRGLSLPGFYNDPGFALAHASAMESYQYRDGAERRGPVLRRRY